MNTAIVPGSISAIAQSQGKSIAEIFACVDCVVIIDTSGSMETHDSRAGMTRYDVACMELIKLQRDRPGKVGVIAFSNTPVFCPTGIPTLLGAATCMDKALAFARIADNAGVTFFLISDGYPDDPQGTLAEARKYKAKIHTIYVGPESESQGRDFLASLAKLTGGQTGLAKQAVELAAVVDRLRLAERV